MIFNLNNPYEADKFKEYVNRMYQQKSVVEVKKKLPNRTLAQISYLHFLLGFFEIKYGCKKGMEVTCLRSSAELTTGEMTLSIERFRNWSASVADIYLPAANEHQMLIYAQQEIQRNQEFI